MAVSSFRQLLTDGPSSATRPPDGMPPSPNPGSKRKAEAPLPDSQRRCLSSPSRSTPEPSSINDILRRHSRSRLYVYPIQWTSDQLELLECRFLAKRRPGLRTGQSGTKKVATCSQQELQAIESKIKLFTRSAGYLRGIQNAMCRNVTVEELLLAFDIHKLR